MSAEVFTQTGERLTKALITGDFDLYARVMALGLEVVPQGGTPFRLETTEALRQDFDMFHQAIIQWGITDIYRKVLQANCREVIRAKYALGGEKITETRLDDLSRLHPAYLEYLATHLAGRTLFERERIKQGEGV